MRRWVVGLVAAIGVLVGVQALANGFGSSDAPPARIPVPARDVSGTFEDLSGTRVDVTKLTWNGEVFVYGKLGLAQATVPFEKIKLIRIEPSSEVNQRVAFVQLVDGGTVALSVDHDLTLYGASAFGNYSITVDKLRRIELR
jgi:hypothetical protein